MKSNPKVLTEAYNCHSALQLLNGQYSESTLGLYLVCVLLESSLGYQLA
jgi:hypothetical protein